MRETPRPGALRVRGGHRRAHRAPGRSPGEARGPRGHGRRHGHSVCGRHPLPRGERAWSEQRGSERARRRRQSLREPRPRTVLHGAGRRSPGGGRAGARSGRGERRPGPRGSGPPCRETQGNLAARNGFTQRNKDENKRRRTLVRNQVSKKRGHSTAREFEGNNHGLECSLHGN